MNECTPRPRFLNIIWNFVSSISYKDACNYNIDNDKCMDDMILILKYVQQLKLNKVFKMFLLTWPGCWSP